MKNLNLVKGIEFWPNSNWCKGAFTNREYTYIFEAKMFEEKSEFGIHQGNISKLWVKNVDTNRVVFNFDRGLDIGTEEMIETGMISDLIYVLSNYAETNHFYKKGDKVKIVEYPPKGSGFITYQGNPKDTEMGKWLGKVMTIVQVQEKCYIMKEDKGRWAWTNSLIESIER